MATTCYDDCRGACDECQVCWIGINDPDYNELIVKAASGRNYFKEWN